MSHSDKHEVRSPITVKAYDVMARCVEEGVRRGWMRAHKHVAKPTAEVVQAEIEQAVMAEICEYFSLIPEGV